MAIEIHEVVPVNDISKAKDLVVHALKKDSCKVKIESDQKIIAKRGSQIKLRAAGGILVAMKDHPVKVVVEFVEQNNVGQLEVSAFSDLGFGIATGYPKYKDAVLDIFNVVALSVESLRMQSKVDKPVPTEEVQFCSNCGNKVTSEAKFCPKCGNSI